MSEIFLSALVFIHLPMPLSAAEKTSKKKVEKAQAGLTYGGYRIKGDDGRLRIMNSPMAFRSVYPYLIRDRVTQRIGLITLSEPGATKPNCKDELNNIKKAKAQKMVTSDPVLRERKKGGLLICEYSYKIKKGSVVQNIYHKKNTKQSLAITFTDQGAVAPLRDLASGVEVE